MITYFNHISFENPYWFLLLITIPLASLLYILRVRNRQINFTLSNFNWISNKSSKTFRQRIIHLPFILRMILLIVLTVIMARPQTTDSSKTTEIEGIDIVLAIDISGSMRARDFKPDRLEAAKKQAIQFVEARTNDRIGLVVFSAEAFTQCPLTTDHQVIKNLIKPLKNGIVQDGTALGDGLATAVNRIKDSEAISKVVILLTDGVQTAGSLDPLTAADIALNFGVRVYTIGVGTKGEAPYPVQTPFGEQLVNMPVEIDEAILKKVSNTTGGQYFRATNNNDLEDVFRSIDQLEKSKIEVSIFKSKYDQYRPLLWFAFALFFVEIIFRLTLLRTKI